MEGIFVLFFAPFSGHKCFEAEEWGSAKVTEREREKKVTQAFAYARAPPRRESHQFKGE